MTAAAPATRRVTTDALVVGDVVRDHGMRIRLDSVRTYDDRGSRVYAFAGTILNLAEVNADGFVPKGFRVRLDPATGVMIEPPVFDSWTVQGNRLAHWIVEAAR